ncbi:MAG: hypothetical protein F7C32_02970 [Desulfurococcales archaeon]|nr:hypothetical protein [Desulfurococcales archaeon]
MDILYSQPGIRPRKTRITVVIPSSVLDTEATGLQRALKASRIARIAAMFRVNEIIVYKWERNKQSFKELCDLLEYAVRPPYLKKYIPLRKTLRHAGVMEPLNIWIHKVSKNAEKHPIRLAQVLEIWAEEALIDAGLQKPLTLKLDAGSRVSKGDIVLVKINPATWEAELYDERRFYTGYTVNCARKPVELFTQTKKHFRLGLTRHGKPLSNGLIKKIRVIGNISLYLGGPHYDIFQVYRGVGFHETVNVHENQGTETLRTEEALCVGLSRLSPIVD